MANTYVGTRAVKGVEPIAHIEGSVTAVISTFALSAAFVINDVVQMATIPTGAYITDVVLSTDTALDTSATGLIRYQVGDSNSANRYFTATINPGNNVPLSAVHAQAGIGYQIGTNTGDNLIQVTIQTAPGTGATTGTMRCLIEYSMEAITATS